MAISNNYVPVKQLGNGATVNYGASWPIFAAAYIRVYLENVITGVQVLQALGTDYTLTFDDSGFVVTFLVAPTAASYVVIGRSIALDQTNPYKTSKGFDGSKIEGSYDKLTGMVQDLNNAVGRSLVFPLGDTTSTQLPTATSRANGFLGFDAVGAPAVFPGVTGIPVSAAMAPVVQAATLNIALALLGGAPLASPALTGVPTAPTAAKNTASGQIANMAAVQASMTGGFVNKFMNPAHYVAQLGASGTVNAGVAGYTTDGWVIVPTGANCAWNRVQQGLFVNPAKLLPALFMSSAVGMTNFKFRQRLFGEDVQDMESSGPVTIQFCVYHDFAGAVTPVLNVYSATALNNWAGATVQVNAVALQSVPSVSPTVLSYTFIPAVGFSNGVQIEVDWGANMNVAGKTLRMSAADFRQTPGVSAGLNSNPPTPEIRERSIEKTICQSVFEKSYDELTLVGDVTLNGAVQFTARAADQNDRISVTYKVTKKTTPNTLAIYAPQSGTAANIRNLSAGVDIGGNFNTFGTTGFIIAPSVNTVAASRYGFHWTADCRL